MADLELLKAVKQGMECENALLCSAEEFTRRAIGNKPKEPDSIEVLNAEKEKLENDFNDRRNSALSKYSRILRISVICAGISLVLIFIFACIDVDIDIAMVIFAISFGISMFMLPKVMDIKKTKWIMPEELQTRYTYNAEYPQLSKQYDESYKKIYAYQEELISRAKKFEEYLDVENQRETYEKMKSSVPAKYRNISDIAKLISIIEDGRAKDMQASINVLVADNQHKELLNQQEMAARRAQAEAERHNKNMEEQAKRHNEKMEEQAKKQTEIAIKSQERQDAQYCKGCAIYERCNQRPHGNCYRYQ